MVGVFAFTFGIHLGKRVPPKAAATHAADGHDAESGTPEVNHLADHEPTRHEAQEQVANAEGTAEVLAEEGLREEVAKSGLRLDTSRQVDLPKVSVAEKTGEPRESGEEPVEVSALLAQGLKRAAPEGKFTLQISAFAVTDAGKAEITLKKLAESGLTPWVREVSIPSKGRWYRVYQGGYETKDDAQKSGSELKARGAIAGFVVAPNSRN